ncbi:DUF2207 domain-containing protein [Desulfovibrio desulfuricans]|uniref:DUF2207 domain-containing protein n=1 Tax=Desulfovibrio desulfuricans TaxID=876 RepID=UPI001F206DBB|nr:DUF2207 domain-containing protein [Desulfovibrio desulfuricans]UIA99451.1 DUF2207 domain-containing protein [Desulfovibrio desulfuricans]
MHTPNASSWFTRRIALTVCALLLCIHAMCLAAYAQERIESFASTVTIHQDGSMHVREAIVVHTEGNQIKKGIYRELPLLYSGPANYSGTVPFTVTSASLDGVPLNPVETEVRGDYIRVLMRGKEPLSTGQHRFVLEYDTSLHLRFYESNGELNWNATGVWGFPILNASCRVILPKGVAVQQTAAWAGLPGSRNSDHITIGRPQTNEATFTLASTLEPDAQLTVAVAFDRQGIADPVLPLALQQQREDEALELARQEEERVIRERGLLFEVLYDNPLLPAQCLAFCAVFLYYFLLWQRLGIDPPKGAIFPRYYPPKAAQWSKKSAAEATPQVLSPLAVEFLYKSARISGRGLAATFLALAFKGLCRISKADAKTYALELPAASNGRTEGLTAEEQTVYRELVHSTGKGEKLLLRPKNEDVRSIFNAARANLKQNFKGAWQLNTWVAVLGWFFVLPLAFAASFWEVDPSLLTPDSSQLPLILLLLAVCMAFCAALALPLLLVRQQAKSLLATLGLMALPLAGIAAVGLQFYFYDLGWLLLLLMIITSIVFTAVIKAPSPAARAVLDEIEGLAMYMRTAELPRMEQVGAQDEKPENTPEVFRRLLPYALVLGLEKTWCNRFADQLQAAALEDSGVDVALVHGHDGWSDFSNGFGSAVSASSASAESSSASGFSSGGGGSGSGSGGGGGGGL